MAGSSGWPFDLLWKCACCKEPQSSHSFCSQFASSIIVCTPRFFLCAAKAKLNFDAASHTYVDVAMASLSLFFNLTWGGLAVEHSSQMSPMMPYKFSHRS